MMPLGTVAVLTLAAAGAGALVRALPWPVAALARKPLSCVACMAGHASWLVLLASWALGAWAWPGVAQAGLLWLAMTGGAAVLLAQTGMFVQPLTFEGETVPPPADPPPHGP